jgi:hypothetical protein
VQRNHCSCADDKLSAFVNDRSDFGLRVLYPGLMAPEYRLCVRLEREAAERQRLFLFQQCLHGEPEFEDVTRFFPASVVSDVDFPMLTKCLEELERSLVVLLISCYAYWDRVLVFILLVYRQWNMLQLGFRDLLYFLDHSARLYFGNWLPIVCLEGVARFSFPCQS